MNDNDIKKNHTWFIDIGQLPILSKGLFSHKIKWNDF